MVLPLAFMPHKLSLLVFLVISVRQDISIATSTTAFDCGLWLRFLQNISFATKLLIDGSHNLFKMPTVFDLALDYSTELFS